MPLSAWAYKLLKEGRCSRCWGTKTGKHPSYCKACYAAYARDWRRRSPKKKRYLVRGEANNAQWQYKVLEPEPCEDCGSPEVEKHHQDYNKPLAVTWLCKPCHTARHRFLKTVGWKG